MIMDRTYCTVYSPGCNVTFDGFDAEKYASIWKEIKDEKRNNKMIPLNFLEKRLEEAQAELKILQDDRNFWQKLFGIKTEMYEKYCKQYNHVCELMDIIFDYQKNLEPTSMELYRELICFLDAESFRCIDARNPIQVWVKAHK